MSQLQLTSVFPSIPPENLEAFKETAGECVRLVKEQDRGTVQYDWYFSADERRCVVHEGYVSSEAMLEHMGNLGEVLGRLLELGGSIEIEVFGEPSPELVAATADFRPAVYSQFAPL